MSFALAHIILGDNVELVSFWKISTYLLISISYNGWSCEAFVKLWGLFFSHIPVGCGSSRVLLLPVEYSLCPGSDSDLQMPFILST